MTAFEYRGDIIILDMGVQFPDEDMPGVDYIIPNIGYFKGKEKNIRAIILSHGHLDHIGAVSHLAPKLGNPLIVASPLTKALVIKRHEEYKGLPKLKFREITASNQTIKLGSFTLTFFAVTHSIMDSFGVVIQTPEGNIIHLGDWRYDLDPVAGKPTDFKHLAKWSTKNVPSVLMMESLGAIHEGHQGSEKEVHNNIKKIIDGAKGRVIIGTFSSMLERIGQIIINAESAGRKVAVDGYSMKANVEIGKKFGYIKSKPHTIIDIAKANDYPNNKIVVICTGAQGEGRAVLMRIAEGEHKHVKVEKSDTIVFSSSVIPGNELAVQRLKDSLYRKGAEVLHKEIMDVHAGGHAKRDDIRLLLKEVKPDFIIPVYANHYMLREAEKLAIREGWSPEKVMVADNGQVVVFEKGRGRLTNERVPTDYVFVDGLGVGDVSHVVLRDRQMMAADGMIVVIVTLDTRNAQLVQNPDLISRGFIYMKENKKLIEETRRRVKKLFATAGPDSIDENYYKDRIRNEVGAFLYQKTQRRDRKSVV